MNIDFQWLRPLLIILGFGFSSALLAQDVSVVAGYIVDINKSNEGQVTVTNQDGTKQKAALLMKLYAGSTLNVQGTSQVTVKIGTQEILVSSSNSPFIVTSDVKSSSLITSLYSWAKNTIANPVTQSRAVYAASRGKMRSLDLLFLNKDNNIIESEAALYLEILDGFGPYRVTVTGLDSDFDYGQENIDSNHVELHDMQLYEGRYELKVCDSYDCLVYPLTVVDRIEELENELGPINEVNKSFYALNWLRNEQKPYLFQASLWLKQESKNEPWIDQVIDSYQVSNK